MVKYKRKPIRNDQIKRKMKCRKGRNDTRLHSDLKSLDIIYPQCLICNSIVNRAMYFLFRELELTAKTITQRIYPDKYSFGLALSGWKEKYSHILKFIELPYDLDMVYNHFSPHGNILCQMNSRRMDAKYLFSKEKPSLEIRRRCWDIMVLYLVKEIIDYYKMDLFSLPKHIAQSMCNILSNHSVFFKHSIQSLFRNKL